MYLGASSGFGGLCVLAVADNGRGHDCQCRKVKAHDELISSSDPYMCNSLGYSWNCLTADIRDPCQSRFLPLMIGSVPMQPADMACRRLPIISSMTSNQGLNGRSMLKPYCRRSLMKDRQPVVGE
jgi:hypothetical protein